MNLYFIVEGRRTEYKIYPSWLQHLLPGHQRISIVAKAQRKNYYLAHGQGIPSLYKFVQDAVEELNELGTFNFLVVCLDAEEGTLEQAKEDLMNSLAKRNLKPQGYEIKVIVQNRCMETWLLGNRRVFQRNPGDATLRSYVSHFDVSQGDPEQMPKLVSDATHAAFHLDYLKRILQQRNMEYTKVSPTAVTTPDYLDQLILRTKETNHLHTLKDFLDFCGKIS
jgi:hypothetical protein